MPAELTQALGRSPTPRELAAAIGCSVEEIIEGIDSGNAYSTLSLDAATILLPARVTVRFGAPITPGEQYGEVAPGLARRMLTD